MTHPQTVSASSEGITGSFNLDWEMKRWTSASAFDEGIFPFVAQIENVRYELYFDNTFAEVDAGAKVYSLLKPRLLSQQAERGR